VEEVTEGVSCNVSPGTKASELVPTVRSEVSELGGSSGVSPDTGFAPQPNNHVAPIDSASK